MINVKKCVVAVFAIGAASACASSHTLTQGEVGRSGSRQFSAPKAEVFAVCLGALAAEGYEIAGADPAAGVIVTRPKAARSSEAATARAYRLTVVSEDGQASVVAQPFLYSGERDISNGEVWTLAGPNGERAQWSELFGLIDGALSGPVLQPTNREVVARSEPGRPGPTAGPTKLAVTPSPTTITSEKAGPFAPAPPGSGLTQAGLRSRPTPSVQGAEPARAP